jgi:hypothetical protein
MRAPKRNDLTPAQRLAVYERKRLLEARARTHSVTAEIVQLQCDPDYDAAVSRLPYRPTPPNPAAVAETRRQVEAAVADADAQTRRQRMQLAAIAAGVLPHTANWKRWTSGE